MRELQDRSPNPRDRGERAGSPGYALSAPFRALAVSVGAAALTVSLLTPGCSTTPITGRSQLSLVPSSQMADFATETYQTMLENETILETGPVADRIRRIAIRVARAAEDADFRWPQRDTFEWEFRVIDNDEVVNAWALPGGKVAVYTGILRIADSDDEVAAVIAHEIAHSILRHGTERFSQELLANGLSTTLDVALDGEREQKQKVLKEAFGIVSREGVLQPYSRSHELEADQVGVLLMAAAGYRPEAALAFWERMLRETEQAPILTTHPSHESRIDRIRETLPRAHAIADGRETL